MENHPNGVARVILQRLHPRSEHFMRRCNTITDEAPAFGDAFPCCRFTGFHRRLPVCNSKRRHPLAATRLAGFARSAPAEPSNAFPRRPFADLGLSSKTPGANIIKLPTSSASIPQLSTAAIKRTASQRGTTVPDLPAEPANREKNRSSHLTRKPSVAPLTRSSAKELGPPVSAAPGFFLKSTLKSIRTRWGPGRPDSKNPRRPT